MARLFTAALLIAFPIGLRADDAKPKGPPAEKILAEGLAKAKQDGKAVFLEFGSPTCGWCKYLDKYHARPTVEKILGKHLVIVKVDVVENPGGEELYKKYTPEQGGVPVWVILASDGKVLVDSFAEENGKKQNVGFPYEPHELAHYEASLRKAIPTMTVSELDALMKELKDAGPKREKKDKQ